MRTMNSAAATVASIDVDSTTVNRVGKKSAATKQASSQLPHATYTCGTFNQASAIHEHHNTQHEHDDIMFATRAVVCIGHLLPHISTYSDRMC